MSTSKRPFFYLEALLLLTMILLVAWFTLDCWSKASALPVDPSFRESVERNFSSPIYEIDIEFHQTPMLQSRVVYPSIRGYREM
ncbi:hypothetical protein [Lunatimonas lonarensis]|uniref:hypothetical protein n=1 Tax=Lunatimonas lonarensis TaxID=1232681 RepID=UPI00056BDFBA|nr:hypothetical protein [Lunatimonas lonarensis]